LLNRYLAANPADADRIVLNVKGGLGPDMSPAGSKKDVARSIDNVLRMIGPQGRIAQFEVGRKDPKVDYEEDTLATIDEYVKSGKIGGISLSEVSAATIRSAAKRFKITAVETELSLFHTDPLTNGILEACGDLGIPVIAYCKCLLSLSHALTNSWQHLLVEGFSAGSSSRSTTSPPTIASAYSRASTRTTFTRTSSSSAQWKASRSARGALRGRSPSVGSWPCLVDQACPRLSRFLDRPRPSACGRMQRWWI